MQEYSEDYLLDKRVRIFQPLNGYRASTDAVILSSLIARIKDGDAVLDVGSGTGAVALCLAERFKTLRPKITGLELQAELAELSNMSAAANGFDGFLTFVNADIADKKKLPAALRFFTRHYQSALFRTRYALAEPRQGLCPQRQKLQPFGLDRLLSENASPAGLFLHD